MKLVVGLGNPGDKYRNNRHNAGFMVVDKLNEVMGHGPWAMNKKFEAEMVQVGEVLLAKPQAFMNDSGRAVAKIVNFYKIHHKDLYVIHDDLDLPIGSYKITFGHGPKVHNGLGSIREMLATSDFWYVKVGVENREVRGNSGVPGVVYSLQNFTSEEQGTMESVIVAVRDDLLKRL